MKRGMNIAFFGSGLGLPHGGAAAYFRGVIRQLHARGHQVTFYEPDAWGSQARRDVEDSPWVKVIAYPEASPDGVQRCVESARDCDVVIKVSGVGVFDALLEEAIPAMARPAMQTVFWDVNAPATLERVTSNPFDPFLALIPKYDMILTHGGGPPVIKAYRSLEARACVPIYNAVDPDTHFPEARQRRFEADAAFLGNRLPDREARVEEFFLKPAILCAGARFNLGGGGWHDKTMPSSVRYLGHIGAHEHNAFNCSSRAVINISRESMARYGYSPAPRVFEAAGAGACILTDHWEGLDQFLEPGRETLVARDGEEVAWHLDGLKPDRAGKIGNAARRRILGGHTYAHRARQLESLLGAAPAARAPA